MDEYKSGGANSVVLAGTCTALAVVLSVIGFYMPLVSSIVFLLIPLPIAYLGMKEGLHWSLIVTAGVMILDSVFFGIISAAFLCAIFGILGVVMGICYKNKVSAQVTLLTGAAAVLAALIGEAVAAMYVLNMPSVLFGGALDGMEAEMMAQMEQFYTGALLTEAQANVKEMMEIIRKSLPFAAVGAALFYSWASMTLGKMVFTRMGIKDIPVLPPLERWEFPRIFAVLYILANGLEYFMKGQETVAFVGYNLGLFCFFIFWLQGLATLWWAPRQYPFVKALRWPVAILSVFVGFVQTFIVLLGLSDMILSYRKKRNYQ